jgi:hypothetical protein
LEKYPQGDSNEPQKYQEKQASPDQRGTDSGTPPAADTLETLAAALLKLSQADRARLAAILAPPSPGPGKNAADGRGDRS